MPILCVEYVLGMTANWSLYVWSRTTCWLRRGWRVGDTPACKVYIGVGGGLDALFAAGGGASTPERRVDGA